jgi:integrase
MIAMLMGCGLRHGELLALRVDSFQSREEHWAIADLLDKAGHIRTVPIPSWVKAAIDEWKQAGCITEGALFASHQQNRPGPPQSVPVSARLSHFAGGELDQIQFLLGHVSI